MLYENQQLKRNIQYLTSEAYVPISNTTVSSDVDLALNISSLKILGAEVSRLCTGFDRWQ